MSRMGRNLVLWQMNPIARSTNLEETSKLNETMRTAMDDLMRQGIVKEIGYFANGSSGYVISEREAEDAFRSASMFTRYVAFEVHEGNIL